MTDSPTRRAAEEIARELARAGESTALSVGEMTPREIALAVEIASRRLAEMDLLAWLTGQYAAIGVNAPKRYPRRPDRVRVRRSMTDAAMKACLAGLAARSGGEGRNADGA